MPSLAALSVQAVLLSVKQPFYLNFSSTEICTVMCRELLVFKFLDVSPNVYALRPL